MIFNDGGAFQWRSAPLSFWRRGVICDAHLPMVTGQMIYNWLLIRHVLYISMIYLSLLIHILIAIRFHKNKGNRKKTSPPHFSFQIPFIYRAFHEGGVWQRGHSTPHLTPPLFNSASILFLNTLLPEIWWRKESEGKSDLLSEVLSEVFAKHLTLWTPSKQRHFRQKSEVVRSFGEFSENNRTLNPRRGAYWLMRYSI